jgi:hypothetical protein
MRLLRCASMAVLVLPIAGANDRAAAQAPNTTKDAGETSLLSMPPRTWAMDAAANELIAMHHKDSYLRYRNRVVNEHGEQVRDVAESRDGTVARLILKDGKPLTIEQDKGERQRLNDLVASPSTYMKHVKNGENDRKTADRLVPLMGDAMIYTYTPGQPQSGRNNGALEIVLDYKPNPKFSPPNTEAEALSGMEGRVWIDAKSRYIVRMEGRIFRPVNFAWGMLAHIYPGGKLELNQTDAGGGRWIFTDFSMQISVRALMVKTVNLHTHAESIGYQILKPMSYQDAIHMLLDTPLPEK